MPSYTRSNVSYSSASTAPTRVAKLCGLGLTSVLSLTVIRHVAAQQVWFAPPDNLLRGTLLLNEDFPLLFTKPAEWSEVASHISVFGLNPYYVDHASEVDLRRILAFLSARHIPLSVGILSLPVEGCGRGVEGLVPTLRQSVGTIYRLKSLGADVRYVSLDEPLTFGHFYGGRDACQYSVQEVARRLAGTVREITTLYRQAKIVDIEVPTIRPLPEWETTLKEWLKEYRNATGRPLDAMVLDVSFRNLEWRESTRRSISILHEHGATAGIIVVAPGGPNVTDASWMAEAKENLSAIRHAKFALDYMIFASWTRHPSRLLPESDPLSLTGLVRAYMQPAAH